VISALALASLVAVGIAMAWPDKRMMSRDIGCARVPLGRTKAICQAVSDSMQWTWMGHAIVSPGWRVTWKSLRQVYCSERINAADLPALEDLKLGSDWRLQDGTEGLIRLIGSENGHTPDPENSIFNPLNSQYILRGGCAQNR
jgi:hypothetical protein